MELFELVLLLLGSVLVSTVFAGFIPKVSLPLVQIAIGIVVAIIFGSPIDIEIDPELFLVLFIAPLLFEESRKADKRALWQSKGSIISLAVGLVFVTVLVVGFCLNAFVPSIPLAAAFALGAALGPTDAVAVTALAKDVKLQPRQSTLLQGEALINDASGVVSFQFAIAAATTGAFSLLDASASFLIDFFGGIILGILCGFAATFIFRLLAKKGFQDTTVNVVFELFMPFVVFLAAEACGVSGILAVVAAGLALTIMPAKPSIAVSEQKVVSSNVWDVIVFVINGIIFVMLGMELAILVSPTFEFSGMSRTKLIAMTFFVTFIVLFVRFVWVTVMDLLSKEPGAPHDFSRSVLKNALTTTFAGPKGAVTLSIAFTIPYLMGTWPEVVPFPHRNDLIFMASGCIVITLLLANFVVPLLAPGENDDRDASVNADIAILRKVIAQLRDNQDEFPESAVNAVIANYEERIAQTMSSKVDPKIVRDLRFKVLDVELDYVAQIEQEGIISQEVCDAYAKRLERVLNRITGRRGEKHALRHSRTRLRGGLKERLGALVKPQASTDQDFEQRRFLIEAVERKAVSYLLSQVESTDPDYHNAAVYLLAEHRMSLRLIEASNAADESQQNSLAGISLSTPKIRRRIEEVEAEALRLELGQIRRAQEASTISSSHASELREQVYLRQMALGED